MNEDAMTDEGLSECPFCGAELLPDEVTKTNEVVVWRHAHNACLLNGALPGIRVPHDVEAWNRRSARTSTAPVAWQMRPPQTEEYAGGSDRWRDCDEELAKEMASRGWNTRPLYASPPPPQPGVRVTEELCALADKARYVAEQLYRSDRVRMTGDSFHKKYGGRSEAAVAMRAALEAALTASIPDSAP